MASRFLANMYVTRNAMEKKYNYDLNNDENAQNVSEPVSDYGTFQKVTPIPGCCTIDALNDILDQVEKNFSEGKGIPHEEAVKRIMAW